jgi:two-component system OmpR family sensor kinase
MRSRHPGPPSVLGRLRGLPLRLTLWVLLFCTAGYVLCAALLIRGDTQERVLRMDAELRTVTAGVQRLVTEEGGVIDTQQVAADPFTTSCPQFAVLPTPERQFDPFVSTQPCVDLDPVSMTGFVMQAIETETTRTGYVPGADDQLVRFLVEPFRAPGGQYAGGVVALLDPSEELAAHRMWMLQVIGGGVLLLGAVGAAAYWLGLRAIRPAATALEHQEALLADTAHDLRTPVAGLRALAEAALANAGQRTELLPRVVELSRRMGTIIDGVLMRARLAAGVEQLAIEPVWLDQLVATVVEETPANGAEVTVTTAPTKVAADPALVQRAIGNLLDNALRHGRVEGKPAVVQVTVAGGRVIVADHGPGIDPSAARETFERFSGSGSSTGLGLAIVRWVAQAHGGTLRVYNADGGGAIFELSLPSAGE